MPAFWPRSATRGVAAIAWPSSGATCPLTGVYRLGLSDVLRVPLGQLGGAA